MKKDADLSKFDKRVANRLIERGIVKEKDYTKFMDELPDVSKKKEIITVEYSRQKQGIDND